MEFFTFAWSLPDLLLRIAESNLSLWVMLAASTNYKPLDPTLVSMLRESSPTDELFYMGAANDPDSRNDVYSETRYILCHMISELFIHLGGGLENVLVELIESDEGYRRLVGVQIVYLMRRKKR